MVSNYSIDIHQCFLKSTYEYDRMLIIIVKYLWWQRFRSFGRRFRIEAKMKVKFEYEYKHTNDNYDNWRYPIG